MNIPATSRRQEFWAGVRAELPLQLGVAPFGLVFGVLGLASGLSAWETILMSSIVFGGASQVVFAQLWGGAVPAPVVGASVSVINLRHVLYSASIAPYLRSLIGSAVRLRYTPRLGFRIDTSFDEGAKIDRLLASDVVQRDLAAAASDETADG